MASIQNASRTSTRPGALIRPGSSMTAMPVVELDARTAFDFLLSGCDDCGELDDMLPEDRAWITKARSETGLQSAIGCIHFGFEAAGALVTRPEIRTARQVIRLIDSLPDAELIGLMFHELLEDPDLGQLSGRAIGGDAEAYSQLGQKLQEMKSYEVLPATLEELAPSVRRVLRSWLPRFEEIEGKVQRMLDRDVADRRLEEAVADPMGFIEKATNGIRLIPEQQTRRIVLAPTYFGRPYNSLVKVGSTTLICYPMADSALGAAGRAAPPTATIRLYRALGDENRLCILRLLAERDRYLTELATELDLSKPTVSHHLAQLRSAGLVTMTEQGNLTYYTLRRDRVEAAGPELSAFLAQ